MIIYVARDKWGTHYTCALADVNITTITSECLIECVGAKKQGLITALTAWFAVVVM